MDLLSKLGKNRYDFVSNIFIMPLVSTLKGMGEHDQGSIDGLILKVFKPLKKSMIKIIQDWKIIIELMIHEEKTVFGIVVD